MVMQLTGHGGRGRDGEAAGQLGVAQCPGHLQQRQRIAASLGDEPVADLLVEVTPRGHGGQQRPGVVVGESVDGQRGQGGEHPLVGRLPDREQEQDGLGVKPSADEPQDLGRRYVEPLGVVDQAHQRPLAGGLGQQAQHGQPDQEPIRRIAARQSERHP